MWLQSLLSTRRWAWLAISCTRDHLSAALNFKSRHRRESMMSYRTVSSWQGGCPMCLVSCASLGHSSTWNLLDAHSTEHRGHQHPGQRTNSSPLMNSWQPKHKRRQLPSGPRATGDSEKRNSPGLRSRVATKYLRKEYKQLPSASGFLLTLSAFVIFKFLTPNTNAKTLSVGIGKAIYHSSFFYSLA